MSNSGAGGGPPSNSVKFPSNSVKLPSNFSRALRQIPSNPSNPSNPAARPWARPISDQKPMKNSKFSWPPRQLQRSFTLGIAMGAKMDLKKPTGRRRRPMKILPHPAPRQIPSNSVKFPSNFRQILAARRAPPSNSVKFRRLAGPPSNSVKFRQIPSNSGPRSGPYYPPLAYINHPHLRIALNSGTRHACITMIVPGDALNFTHP